MKGTLSLIYINSYHCPMLYYISVQVSYDDEIENDRDVCCVCECVTKFILISSLQLNDICKQRWKMKCVCLRILWFDVWNKCICRNNMINEVKFLELNLNNCVCL